MQTVIEFWQFIIAWYNVPFTLSLVAFLGLSGLQFIGLGGEQELDVEADVDVDLDMDLAAEADIDVDVEPDINLNVDVDTDGEVAFEGGSTLTALINFLGVGKVPLTIILLLLLGSFGFTGWVLNNIILSIFSTYLSLAIGPIFLMAIAVSVVTTGYMGQTLGRLLPSKSTSATSYKQLVGQQGEVVSHVVNESFGQVRVRDRGGNIMTVYAVIDPGKPPLKQNDKAVLLEYVQKDRMFVVVAAD